MKFKLQMPDRGNGSENPIFFKKEEGFPVLIPALI